MLLRHFLHTFLLEQRAAGAAEWAVRLHQDTLLFAKVDNLLLRQVGVVLDLVGGGDNSCLAQQLLQVGNASLVPPPTAPRSTDSFMSSPTQNARPVPV